MPILCVSFIIRFQKMKASLNDKLFRLLFHLVLFLARHIVCLSAHLPTPSKTKQNVLTNALLLISRFNEAADSIPLIEYLLIRLVLKIRR